jgi:cytochrome P450
MLEAVGVAFDPFEPGFDAWPYDQYRRLREHEPVHWSELLSGWVITRYDDVARVLRERAMSSDLDFAEPSPVVDLLRARATRRQGHGVSVVLVDDPEHARLRKVLQVPFTARRVEALRASVAARVDAAFDALVPKGAMELIADLAYPLPVSVFCEMLGIPEEEGERFRGWTAAVARSLDLVISEQDYDDCMALQAEMESYLSDVANAKRVQPGDDVVSALIDAEVDGERLTHGELVAQLVTLYVAGHEPTTALVGNGMAHLLANPDQLAALRADPERVPTAVHELLRYDGPNQFVRRIALEPVAIDGHTIEPGQVVYVGIGAANHDPARWGPDAEQLRVDRDDASQHVQFGGGVHHCLGAHLARMQAEVALTALVTRLPDLRLDGPVTWAGRSTLRSVSSVPLAWSA